MKFRFCHLALGASLTLGIAPSQAQPAKPHGSLPDLTVPGSVGVNIHFTDAKPGEMKMISEAGFRIARMDFFWNETEKAKGVYDFSAYDRLLKQLEAVKIQPLFILVYTNPLYDENLSPHTDHGRAAFAKWAAAAAVHFKWRKVLWEMYNEPNGFWRPKTNVEDYIKLALATGKAIKAAAPAECYVGPAVSGFEFSFLESCFKAGLLNYWDAVSVHPYRGGEPESASDEYRRLRLMIDRHKPKGKTIPVLSGEWGYSSKGMSEEQQAKYLSRQWLTNLMNRVPVSIWYDWHNDGPDPQENEHNFGTVRHEYHVGREPIYDAKPNYVAARTFTQAFNGFRFNKRLALGSSNDYLLLFSKGKEVKLVAWSPSSEHQIVIAASVGSFKVTDYMGRVQPDVRAGAAGLWLKVSDAPIYLTPTAPNEVLTKAAAWQVQPSESEVFAPSTVRQGAKSIALRRDSAPLTRRSVLRVGTWELVQETQVVVANPLSFAVEPSLNGKLLVHATNLNDVPIDGTVTLQGNGARRVVLKEGESDKTFETTRPKPEADGSWMVKLRFAGPKPEDVVETSYRFVPMESFANLTSPSLPALFVPNPDGDPQVASEQELSIAGDAEPASPDGGPVVRLKYRMAQGWKFINIQPRGAAPVTVQGKPKQLGMWVYGDNSGNHLRMRFRDSSGQTFQPGGVPANWAGWKYVTFPLGPSNAHWGGANDGKIHGAFTVESLLLLDSATQKGSEGEIYFASPSWIY